MTKNWITCSTTALLFAWAPNFYCNIFGNNEEAAFCYHCETQVMEDLLNNMVIVCSYCPTPKPIQHPKKNGLYRLCGGVHTAQETDANIKSHWVITDRNSSCWKVMYSQMSVCPQGGVHPLSGRHPLAGTPPPRDGYCIGRYVSYWNAFLCVNFFTSARTGQTGADSPERNDARPGSSVAPSGWRIRSSSSWSPSADPGPWRPGRLSL